MNEPRRMREEAGSDLERALLDAGSSYGSSDAARTRTLAALGIAGTATLTASTAAGASATFLTKAGWTKLLALSAVGITAAVPVGYYAWQRVGYTPAPAVAVQKPSDARPVVPAPAAPEPATPEARVEPQIRSVPVAPKAEPRASSASALTAELGALDAARSRLSSGDAPGALSLLDEYARTYPRGRLLLEAEVLRIDALAKSGQRAAAKRRAEAFLTRHPNSVLASRVRTYLSD
jgi:hypothetical protein